MIEKIKFVFNKLYLIFSEILENLLCVHSYIFWDLFILVGDVIEIFIQEGIHLYGIKIYCGELSCFGLRDGHGLESVCSCYGIRNVFAAFDWFKWIFINDCILFIIDKTITEGWSLVVGAGFSEFMRIRAILIDEML